MRRARLREANILTPYRLPLRQWPVNSPYERAVKDAAAHWLKTYEAKPANLILHGPTGTGKSRLAYALAWELLESGKTVACAEVTELLKAMKACFGGGDIEPEDLTWPLMRPQASGGPCLLVLDDICPPIVDDERQKGATAFAAETLRDILNAAIRDEKRLIVTTNLNQEQMLDWFDVHGSIVSRLRENAVIVDFAGIIDHRRPRYERATT